MAQPVFLRKLSIKSYGTCSKVRNFENSKVFQGFFFKFLNKQFMFNKIEIALRERERIYQLTDTTFIFFMLYHKIL